MAYDTSGSFALLSQERIDQLEPETPGRLRYRIVGDGIIHGGYMYFRDQLIWLHATIAESLGANVELEA